MMNRKKKAYQNTTNYLMQQQTQNYKFANDRESRRGGVDGENVVNQMIPYILVKQIEFYLCVIPDLLCAVLYRN